MNSPDILESPGLRLRRFAESDTALLFAQITSDPLTMRFIPWPVHTSLEDTRSLVANYLASQRAGEKFFYIAEAPAGVPVGLLTLYPKGQRITLGLIVIAAHRRRGHGRAMIRLVFDWALAQREDWVIAATCDAENHASAATLAAAGFVRDGVLPGAGSSPNAGPGPRDLIAFSWRRPAPT